MIHWILFFVFSSLSAQASLIPLSEPYPVDQEQLYFQTNHGDFVVQLYLEEVPNTVSQIKTLVRLGAYDGVEISSASPDYYVQIDSVTEKEVPLLAAQRQSLKPILFEPSGYQHERGTVSVTLSPEGASGESALTLFMGPSPDLDSQQTIIGKIVHGMSTLNTIEKLPTDDDDYLLEKVRVLSARLLAPQEASHLFQRSQTKSADDFKKYSLWSFALIAVFALVLFFLSGKISQRNQIALVMMMGFIAIFNALILWGQSIEQSSLQGTLFFFALIALFKFLNRFESQQ